MIKDVEQAIRDYLPQVLHMSLGTCANNRPWVCDVHFGYDDDLNLYFRSTLQRRHSQEIASNPYVAGDIVAQHGPADKPRGVYFEGFAELLTDVDESSPAYRALRARASVGPDILAQALEPTGHKFYKITVSDFYLFDVRESKPSQKYHVAWKGSLV